jgi:dihydroneopterin aldolase
MDRIRIKGLELDCIVGVRPLEREREQRVHLDIAMDIDLSAAGRTGRIALTCDYAQIAEEIIAMLRFRRYHLIEMATEEIAAMLLGVHSDLLAVEIALDKPAALDGRARAASVEIRRDRSQYSPFPLSESDDQTLVILETRDAGLYLFRVAPGAPLPPTVGRGRRELEWVQSGQLLSSGAMLGLHEPRVREGHLTAPVLMNRSTETAVLFRCVCPPLHRGMAPVSLRPGHGY